MFLQRAVVADDYSGGQFVDFFRAERSRELVSTASSDIKDSLVGAGIKVNVEKVKVLTITSLLKIYYEVFLTAPSIVLIDAKGIDEVLVQGIDQCGDVLLMPDFLFFEQLRDRETDLQLTNFSLIDSFVPADANHVKSMLYRRNF